MSKTKSEAARALLALHHFLSRGDRVTGAAWSALAAIEREDAERAVMAEVKAVDCAPVAAEATDDGPGYWTPPPGVDVPEWAGCIAWNSHGGAIFYHGTEMPNHDGDGYLWNPGRKTRAGSYACDDRSMAGQWRLIRRPAPDLAAGTRTDRPTLGERGSCLFCPQCGNGVSCDEDGLCVNCGSTTCDGPMVFASATLDKPEPAADEVARLREELEKAQKEVSKWRTDRDEWVRMCRKREDEVERLQARLARIAQEAKS